VLLTAASQCFRIARATNLPTSLSFYSCVIMWRNTTSQCSMQYSTASSD